MSERIEAHKQALASAREYLNRVLDAVGDRWETPVYADGAAWNARQVLVHLSGVDKAQNTQIMRYAVGEEVVPPDFDLERYNRRVTEKMAHVTVEDARASLAASRAELLAWLDTIDDGVLEKQGRHATLRMMTVDQFLDVLAAHERGHARDIAGALGIEA